MRSLIRWSPVDEMTSLQSEMDRVFGRFFGDWSPNAGSPWVPATEVSSHAEGWKVRIALPGVDPKNVHVDLDGRVLRVAGERSLSDEDTGAEHRTSEFGYGRFERSFTVPEGVEADKVSARFENGMLELTLPETEAAKPRRIEIADGPAEAESVA